ncbi:MAG: virulence factor Mce family protein [Streptosporangiaceae bacterium]|jgi:phospholipid/cholesterol/gamma-HCH transport system substrate-binding protein|nr:virulence factor Mce family protein [Streptosporangiaceae bacterium]
MPVTTYRGHNPHLIAIIGTAVLAVAVIFAYAFGTLGLGKGGYTVSGRFAGTGGLKSGDDVQVAGVRVGEVKSVNPDFSRGDVVITWRVDDGIDLGSQTHADIEAANLLGGQYIKLSGPVARPYLRSLSQRQRQIPASRTSIPSTLNQSIDSATNLATRLDTASVNKVLTEAAGIDPPDRRQLSQMLANLDKLTTTLNQRAPEIQAIIANSKKLTGTLAAKDEQLSQLLTYGQTLLTTLRQRRDDLRGTLGNGSQVVNTLNQVITQHQTELNTVLSDLHILTQALTGKNLPALNISMAWLGPTFTQLSQDTGNGRWMEGGLAGLGPIGPQLLGPEPSFLPPNYPYPGVPTVMPTPSGGRK